MERDAPLEPDPLIEAYKKHVDRTLLRENLKRTVQERLDRLVELQRLAEEARRAGREAKSGGGDYTRLRQRTIRLDLFGHSCLCLDLAELVRVKRAAGRPKDLEAVAELEA